jgi:hypothetical protein
VLLSDNGTIAATIASVRDPSPSTVSRDNGALPGAPLTCTSPSMNVNLRGYRSGNVTGRREPAALVIPSVAGDRLAIVTW